MKYVFGVIGVVVVGLFAWVGYLWWSGYDFGALLRPSLENGSMLPYELTSHGTTKMVSIPSFGLTFEVPTDWVVSDERFVSDQTIESLPSGEENVGVDAQSRPDALTIPAGIALTGTQDQFDTLQGLQDGYQSRGGAVVGENPYTKVKNLTIDSRQAVYITTQGYTAGTSSSDAHIVWIRANNKNWYIVIHVKNDHFAIDQVIITQIIQSLHFL